MAVVGVVVIIVVGVVVIPSGWLTGVLVRGVVWGVAFVEAKETGVSVEVLVMNELVEMFEISHLGKILPGPDTERSVRCQYDLSSIVSWRFEFDDEQSSSLVGAPSSGNAATSSAKMA